MDGRPATAVPLGEAVDVAIDTSGAIFVAEPTTRRVRRVDPRSGIIFSVAGTGDTGSSGDGGPATKAVLGHPVAVEIDPSGDLLIIDSSTIRRIDRTSGVITRIAGASGGWYGFHGDGGPATKAGLNSPAGLTVAPSGTIYVADWLNHRIRRVDPAGIISTYAGGAPGFSGDGGPAIAAQLLYPSDVALDSAGNLYIADNGNHRIRKIDGTTGTITTIAGTGDNGHSGDGGPATAAALEGPAGIASDAVGNLFVTNRAAGVARVRRIDAATGIITTIAGGGPPGQIGDGGEATSADLEYPKGIALDPSGQLYVATTQRIRQIDLSSRIISTVAGTGAKWPFGDNGPATSAILDRPRGITVDRSGDLLIADYVGWIRKVDLEAGIIRTIAGNGEQQASGDGGLATMAGIGAPSYVAVDSGNNIYIADSINRIRRIDAITGVIATLAGGGSGGDGSPATEAQLSAPSAVAVDSEGNLYISETRNHRVLKVDADGIIRTFAGNSEPGDGGPDPGDGGPATLAVLNEPRGLAIDTTGGLLIADSRQGRIRRVDRKTGTITTVAGGGALGDGAFATEARLNIVVDVAVGREGSLFIAEVGRLRKVAADGTISTVAGTGTGGFYTGDEGPATAAVLSMESIAVDGSGDVFLVQDKRIRAVFACVNVDAAELLSPSDQAAGIGRAPRISWSASPGNVRYDLVLDTVYPPRMVVAADLSVPTFSPGNLQSATTYYWKVVTRGDPFCEPVRRAESPVRSFTTASECGRGFGGD